MKTQIPANIQHLSIDLWDTLLRRKCHPDEVKLYTAQRMLHILSKYLEDNSLRTMELLRRRQKIEADIGNRCINEGYDDEYEIDEVLTLCILDVVDKPLEKDTLAGFTDFLVQCEIEQEIAVTYVDEDLVKLLQSYNYERLHVISDFYMSAKKIKKILHSNNVPLSVDYLFISCDSKFNKRSGRLFEHVCSTLSVAPDEILHIGDNFHTDVQMAEKSGLRAYHFTGVKEDKKREKNHCFFDIRQEVNRRFDSLLLSRRVGSQLTFSDEGNEHEKLRSYGRYMSPFFAGFSLYVQELCYKRGHQSAYFFTREGRFFKKVFDLVQSYHLFDLDKIKSRLLPVSRLASFFPSLRDLTVKEMMRLWSQYHTQSVNSFLESLGLDSGDYAELISNNGVDPEEKISSPWQDELFLQLFANKNFLDRLYEDHKKTRQNLLAFFGNYRFGHDGKAFIVDIGWRGTIQDNLALIFPSIKIDGCYLGLQQFFNTQPNNTRKFAYIADENEGEFHVMLKHVMPIEMLCFGKGGSAIGYFEERTGKFSANFQCDPLEENFYNEWIRYFQEGVLDGVNHVCRAVAQHGISVQELRTESNILASQFLMDPPMVMCKAFNAFKQDDTFGMARTISPKESTFRLTDRILARFSARRRERFFADLEESGWPQCLLRSRYLGSIHYLENIKKKILNH